MNERIQELAGQVENWKVGNVSVAPYLPSLERFAELIIKECITQCEAIGYEWHKIDTPRASGKKAGAFECAVELKEHFGIK